MTNFISSTIFSQFLPPVQHTLLLPVCRELDEPRSKLGLEKYPVCAPCFFQCLCCGLRTWKGSKYHMISHRVQNTGVFISVYKGGLGCVRNKANFSDDKEGETDLRLRCRASRLQSRCFPRTTPLLLP